MAHEDWVSSVAFSPDGRTILTGCYDRTARLWDRATGRPIGRPLRHQHCVRSVAFSPDGKLVLTGSFDGIARLWDVATGSPVGPPLRHQHTVSAVAFSPDGRTVLTAGFDKTALIWEVARTSGLSFSHEGFIRAVLFSPDGRTILSASQDHTARLWDAATGEPIGPPLVHDDVGRGDRLQPRRPDRPDRQPRPARPGSGTPRRATRSGPPSATRTGSRPWPSARDGDTVLTGSDDRTARLWDAATGAARRDRPCATTGGSGPSAFSPDGRLIADRQRRQDGPALGRGRRASPSASPSGTGARSWPWPSAPTAGPS